MCLITRRFRTSRPPAVIVVTTVIWTWVPRDVEPFAAGPRLLYRGRRVGRIPESRRDWDGKASSLRGDRRFPSSLPKPTPAPEPRPCARWRGRRADTGPRDSLGDGPRGGPFYRGDSAKVGFRAGEGGEPTSDREGEAGVQGVAGVSADAILGRFVAPTVLPGCRKERLRAFTGTRVL